MFSALEIFLVMRYINLLFYLLTYLLATTPVHDFALFIAADSSSLIIDFVAHKSLML